MSYEPTPTNDSEAQFYIDRGEVPPWRRVYYDGVDVTDQHDLWPDWVKDPSILRKRKRGGRR